MTYALAKPATMAISRLYVKAELVPGTEEPELTFAAADARTWPSKDEAEAAAARMTTTGFKVVELQGARAEGWGE